MSDEIKDINKKATGTKKSVTPDLAQKKESRKLTERIAGVLLDKKAFDVVAIEVDKLTTLADFFVIASAKSTTAVRAIFEAVEEKFKPEGLIKRREGMREGRWIAVDLGAVILHIFLDEVREFYQLERLWMDDTDNVIRF